MFWQALRPPIKVDQKRLVPETVQTSQMDCGAAALKSLLEGFGIAVNYGRLREACQTSVDGTSIDVLEEVANELGLSAEQIILPPDHLLLKETDALPALGVVQLPNGLTHFVVVWSAENGQVQLMDPQVGRRWLTEQQLFAQLFVHEIEMDGAAWREWAGSDGFVAPLRARLTAVSAGSSNLSQHLDQARQDPSWLSLAKLDAATRLTQTLINANVITEGTEAVTLIAELVAAPEGTIPNSYWFARSIPDQSDMLMVRGAVLVRAGGVLEASVDTVPSERTDILTQPNPHPLREMWQLLREDGLLAPTVIAMAAAMAAIGVTLEAVVLRGILDVGAQLTIRSQRVMGFSLFISFALLMLLLEFFLSQSVQRMGRHLDTRLRVAFLSKIPKLGDRYFQSRLISDMTMRVHELTLVRQFPALGVRFLRVGFQLILTTVGVAILIPEMLGVVLAVLVVAVAPSLLMQSFLREQDLRLQSHSGGLSRFYLDGLLGLVAIRAHSAEKSLQTAHETLLTEWVKAGRTYNNLTLIVQGAQAVVGTLCAIWIVLAYLASSADPAGLLLLFYWVLNLPQLGQQFAGLALQYPQLRNRVQRIVEPLGAPDDDLVTVVTQPTNVTGGVSIALDNVTVEAAGTPILRDISATIGAGEHIAIVGASGAGKSSLVGLLLGWHRAAIGTVRVDGAPLDLDALRQQTAWVDPSVQIWNQFLADNLLYGNSAENLNTALQTADLYDVLERLPDGMQTKLGEGGGLVSGGEGQRVRLGRALMRPDARLVILDEPFRGLARDQRSALLAKIRAYWSNATLLFISHNVADTQDFDRVLFLADGHLIEDAPPQRLAKQSDTAYCQLLDAEASVQHDLWQSDVWRHFQLKNGHLNESAKTSKSIR